MPNIRIQLCTEAAISSALIRWGTHSPYSHCDFVMPDGRLLGSRFGLSRPPDGVAIRPKDYTQFSATKVISFPVDEAHVLPIAEAYIGTKYDWLDDAGYVIPALWKHLAPNRINCSGLVSHCLAEAGFRLYECPHYAITPRDIDIHPLATRV